MRRLLISLVVSVVCVWPSYAYTAQTEYRVKAAFIEKFTRFIEWPESIDRAEGETFHICVIGNGRILDPLNQLALTTSIKNKSIVIRVLDRPERVRHCELIYLSTSNRTIVDAILNVTRDKPILTVGDARGLAKQGIMINFFESSNRLRFEINIDAVKQSGFLISSRLLKVAKIVRTEGQQE